MNHLLLVLSLAAWLVVLLAFVLCFKAPAPNHKWLWALFVVFGIVQISLGQAGGAYNVASVTIAVLRPDFIQTGPVPSLPKIVIPVGALVFLLLRRSRVVRDDG
jgi:hypothetical protein